MQLVKEYIVCILFSGHRATFQYRCNSPSKNSAKQIDDLA